MLAATTVAHDAAQLQADNRMHSLFAQAPEREGPFNPRLRWEEREETFNPQSCWEDPGVEEVGGEESDHVTTLAGLLEIGTLVTGRLMTLQVRGIANSGRVI